MHDYIWVVVNNSLREGMVTLALKQAVMCLLLKGPVQSHGLMWIISGPFRSKFRMGYGSEIALIRLLDYTCWEQNGGSVTILTLLDFSVAFDIISDILLDWLWELVEGSTLCANVPPSSGIVPVSVGRKALTHP